MHRSVAVDGAGQAHGGGGAAVIDQDSCDLGIVALMFQSLGSVVVSTFAMFWRTAITIRAGMLDAVDVPDAFNAGQY